MKPITWNEDGVRAECLHCGAHTKFDPDEYMSALDEGRSVWCSTCASFHLLATRADRILPPVPVARELAVSSS